MTKRKGKRGFLMYKSYSFVNKDPVIDRMRTVWGDTGLSLSQIEKAGGPPATTSRNWFMGDTKRPQFATINAFARTCGVDFLDAIPSKKKSHLKLVAGGRR